MKFRSLMTAICVLATANMAAAAPFAYIANSGNVGTEISRSYTVTVIDTVDNSIKATVPLPDSQSTLHPYAYGVTVGASGQFVYVGLQDTNEVSVIDTFTNTVVKRIGLGTDIPGGLAVNTAETRLYVASSMSNTLIVIDISGSIPSEVARVTVENAALSNPQGVVLSPAGDKAYVANSSTNTIAEISLNEATDNYTRTSLTTVGSQPHGLALSPNGNTLYVSSLTGQIKAVKLSDKSITDLSTNSGDNGVVTLAVKPDGSRVYAPANSPNKLYVIDSSAATPVVLGTQYSVIDGPYAAAVTPDGAKLYITMNTGTGGETVSVLNTADLAAAPVSIALPTGAKPTSMGNFIGPNFDYTIASTNGTGCGLSPVGTIPVNGYGRKFVISQSTPCDVSVDGVSVGQPTSYVLNNITNSTRTISTTPATVGTYYTLTASWYNNPGAEAGFLVSTPAGINANSKSAKFLADSTVAIKANQGFVASNWTGACIGTTGSTCTLSALAADKTFGATIDIDLNPGGPIYNVTKGSYYQAFAEATTAAANNDFIKVSNTVSSVTTTGTAGTMVKMSSQWTLSYDAKGTYNPLTLTITNVGVTVSTEAGDTLTL